MNGAVRAPHGVTSSPRLVLLRHGESEWNNPKKNLFCGWVDVDLSTHGVTEARQAAAAIAAGEFNFAHAFTSALHRAQRTLAIVLEDLRLRIPVEKSWRLNERHYGALTGLNKHEAVDRFGLTQVEVWRRSFSTPPPPVSPDSPYHPLQLLAQSGVDVDVDVRTLPATESLQDVIARFEPYWLQTIKPNLRPGEDILIVAHGTTVRCIAKLLLGMTAAEVEGFDVPTALPFVLEFGDDLQTVGRSSFLADDLTVKAAQEMIKNQIRK